LPTDVSQPDRVVSHPVKGEALRASDNAASVRARHEPIEQPFDVTRRSARSTSPEFSHSV
jgi:hypothetical protein